jgi:hypothetical protein
MIAVKTAYEGMGSDLVRIRGNFSKWYCMSMKEHESV